MTAQQSIAARKTARMDRRYKKRKSGDPLALARKTQEKLVRERERDARKGKKKK